MRRIFIACLLLAGCVMYRGPGQDAVTFNVGLAPDSALRLARAELLGHGYAVIAAPGGRTITTAAREVPAEANPASGPGVQYWTLRLDAMDASFTSGTTVRVAGYLIPMSTDSGSTARRTIPVTAENRRLFDAVRAAANWVEAAAKKKGR